MTTTTTYPFTDQELRRLASYRAAVAAGFYTEWPRGAQTRRRTDVRLLARLLRPTGGVGVPEYPFSEMELARLEACRAAVAAGYYSDEV
ncbi:MAG TPA: hypothetical protein VFA49_07385 [Chloroflexota bacterium]|nr:hypothetical protein [Chloroflexota bacterium]